MSKKFTNYQKFSVAKNAIIDEGDGIVSFSEGLTITDDSEQRNGTRYDIASMKLDEYDGGLTANHSMEIQEIIGKTFGVRKQGNRITIDGIRFAIKQSALAQYAYDMLKAGFLTDFSIETYGPIPNDEGVYIDSRLIGLSAVVVGNNKSAKVNDAALAVAMNAVKESKKNGLDTEFVEKVYLEKNNSINENKDMNKKVKNSPDKEVKEETPVAPEEETETTEVEETKVEETKVEETKVEEKQKESVDVAAIIKEAVAPLQKKITDMEQNAFDNSAKEPEFKKSETKTAVNNLPSDARERHGMQINYAWDMLTSNNREAGDKLREINEYHVEELKKEGIVSNTLTIADFGNFVISPELLSDIEGHRSDYSPLLSRVTFQETLSTQMAWLKRNGDVDMEEIEMCDDDANGNLKTISEYSASINTSNLHELAAVTPVCNAATRFLAADLLGDVAAGYRNDYDRKKAQLVIARMQQAVDSTGNSETYATTSDVNSLKSWVDTWSAMQEEIMNGVFIISQKTYGELVKTIVGAGISGPLAGIFTTGDQAQLLGSPYIVVPNDLLPPLNTAETKSFVVEGVTVTINQAAFYADLSQFSGRTSGGLQYDLSTEAAYEDGGTVKSAFQRNELVLRGSFFRGGAIRDEDKVVGLASPGVS